MLAGLPFAVAVGWGAGRPADLRPVTSVPADVGGAGGIGPAPARTTAVAPERAEPVEEWAPQPPRRLRVETREPVRRPSRTAAARPSASATTSPSPSTAGPSVSPPATTGPTVTPSASQPPPSTEPWHIPGLLPALR